MHWTGIDRLGHRWCHGALLRPGPPGLRAQVEASVRDDSLAGLEAVETGRRIVEAAGIDVGGIEYLESDGELVFYDVNANSNLRPAIAREFGFDPFERVVAYLEQRLAS